MGIKKKKRSHSLVAGALPPLFLVLDRQVERGGLDRLSDYTHYLSRFSLSVPHAELATATMAQRQLSPPFPYPSTPPSFLFHFTLPLPLL